MRQSVMALLATKCEDTSKAETGDGELVAVKRSSKLNFGSLPPNEHLSEVAPTVLGTGEEARSFPQRRRQHQENWS